MPDTNDPGSAAPACHGTFPDTDCELENIGLKVVSTRCTASHHPFAGPRKHEYDLADTDTSSPAAELPASTSGSVVL